MNLLIRKNILEGVHHGIIAIMIIQIIQSSRIRVHSFAYRSSTTIFQPLFNPRIQKCSSTDCKSIHSSFQRSNKSKCISRFSFATKICRTIFFSTSTNNNYHQSEIGQAMTIEEWDESDKQIRHERLDEIYTIPTLEVPAPYIQSLLKPNSLFRSYLAIDVFDGIHPKVKMVRDFCDGDANKDLEGKRKNSLDKIPRKLLLLHPKCTVGAPSSISLGEEYELSRNLPGIPKSLYKSDDNDHDEKTTKPSLSTIMKSCHAGPHLPIKVPYTHLPLSTLMQKLLPSEAHPPPTSYEMIGTVAHFNLKSHHIPHQRMIGEIILERFYPQIQTVVNKVGEVKGPYRTYDMEVMAKRNGTKRNKNESKVNPFWVKVVENSLSFEFDIRKVYWCTRLSGERQRLLKEEIVHSNQTIADAFCGVGAFCIHAAKQYNATIIANDWNPDAIQYVKDNSKQNGLSVGKGKQLEVTAGDARDFIRSLGRREEGLPDHLVMNYPLGSPQFLDALRWWPTRKRGNLFRKAGIRRKLKVSNSVMNELNCKADDKDMGQVLEEKREEPAPKEKGTMVHVYTFSKPSSEDDRDCLDFAIDLVAEGLLVEAGEPGEAEGFLNRVLGCEARAKEVRDVAPGKAVVCVTFRVTDKLIRHMQGDFIA